MLFTDGPFITSAGLDLIDGEFSKVAMAEGIIVDESSNSIIRSSTLALGSYFTSRIQNFSGYLVGIGVNSNHVAAVLNILSTAINRPRALLYQIPVTEPDPTRRAFKRWAQYYCLHDFYRACFGRKLSDRFEKKMNFYEGEARKHWTTLTGNGFPVILNPLARPGAQWTVGSGTWGNGNVTTAAGGSQASTISYDVAITWCCLPAYVSPTNQGNAESAGSQAVTIQVAPTNVIQVSIAGLTPPTGTMALAIGTAQGVYPPMAATHWNLYIGVTPTGGAEETWTLQNATPIPIGTTSYALTDVPSTTGALLNEGAPAQYDFSLVNILWRG